MRVKRGNVARKRRKKILKLAKGFRGSLSKLFRPANQVVLHAGNNAYRDRRLKKRSFRSLWVVRLNAALRLNDLTYSSFINMCKKKNIGLNRKVLSEIAYTKSDLFSEIVGFVKK